TTVDRTSYKWRKLYNARTAVERVNSRLDVSFGFENHMMRGLKRITFECTLALAIMNTIAIGRISQDRKDLMRSLVRTA
ncbi:MAG: transposase, partial [Clostridiales Family XIII bacterium]|nr:transposase [Clostridiales Family XIII bacterium]